MSQNSLLLLPISALHETNFVIEIYQRGYKWGKKEILELLNDIDEYETEKGVYCLQPLILKPLSTRQKLFTLADKVHSLFIDNEIIDGQQRTTSIYLIIHFLKTLGIINDPIDYSINYKIRERSGYFIRNELSVLFEFLPNESKEDLSIKNYKDLTELHISWSVFIEKYNEYNNVDIYHFFTVGYYIKLWINQYLAEDVRKKEIFVEKLLTHIHVIWYSLFDAVDNLDVIKVFLNNNRNKIPLTTSELIKALFILAISNKESKSISTFKINRFALEWDQVEKKMQDDTFWYFIQPDPQQYNKGTRIDFLFDLDLLSRKGLKKQDDYFAYREYEKLFNDPRRINEKLLETEWGKVIELFNKLVDWYNDPFLYHYVGYLTVTGIKSLNSLISLSAAKTKLKFRGLLPEEIKSHFSKKVTKDGKEVYPYQIDNLHYERFYKQTLNVLLLYNVLYYVDKMSQNKFPFELYVKEEWSIEHIVPQNPKEFESSNDFVQYKMWFDDQLMHNDEAFINLNDEKEIVEKLNEKNSFEELKKDKDLKDLVDQLTAKFGNTTHLISNLLLLDRNTNSSLGNLFFKQKREKILKFDKKGRNDESESVFIPVETLNAFNKTFSNEIELKHWSNIDGSAYKNEISTRLKNFLP